MTIRTLILAGIGAAAIGCSQPSKPAPTPAEATAFLDNANATTLKLGIQQSQASWVQQNFITDDTEAIAARANQAANEAGAQFAKESVQFDTVQVPADQRRMLNLLKVSLVLATPSDPKESDELSKIMARLESTYGKGKWCADAAKPETCRNIDDISRILSVPGDEPALRAAWQGWHTISPPMRKDYQRFVELSNKGAKELGFANTGAMWRSPTSSPRSSIGCGIRCGRST
jgi:peptidyl-dipeptidase A